MAALEGAEEAASVAASDVALEDDFVIAATAAEADRGNGAPAASPADARARASAWAADQAIAAADGGDDPDTWRFESDSGSAASGVGTPRGCDGVRAGLTQSRYLSISRMCVRPALCSTWFREHCAR